MENIIGNITRIAVLTLILTGTSVVSAASADAEMQEDAQIKKIARSKSYPGGVDEEPLKVQAQLPVIKKDGQNELEAPEPVDAD